MNRTLLLLLLGCMAAVSAAAEERAVSKYTSTARAQALQFREDTGEGADGFRALFKGFGPYQLEHLAGDARSWINIRYRDKTVDLYEQTMNAAGGTFPQKANETVEWRGVEKDGRFAPYAVIYRIEAGNAEGTKSKTRLLVIKLDGDRSRIIGHASGANEDAQAKRIADRSRTR